MEDQVKQWNSSPYEFSNNYRPFKSKWVPLAGKKRKHPDEQDPNAEECERPAAKQFAIDDEVAPSIIKDGYIIDESDESSDSHYKEEVKLQLEDIEMEEEYQEMEDCYTGSQKSISGHNSIFVGTGVEGGGGGDKIRNSVSTDDEDEEHAIDCMGLSGQINNTVNLHQLGSVVLSEEVRASLAKKPNDDSTLSGVIPPSIVDQMYKNARAVVLWQPPQEPMSFISNSIKNDPVNPLRLKQTDENENHDEDDGISELQGDSNNKHVYHRPLLLNDQLGASTFDSELSDMEIEGLPMSSGISQ